VRANSGVFKKHGCAIWSVRQGFVYCFVFMRYMMKLMNGYYDYGYEVCCGLGEWNVPCGVEYG